MRPRHHHRHTTRQVGGYSASRTREWILCALASLIFFWCICFVIIFRSELQQFHTIQQNNLKNGAGDQSQPSQPADHLSDRINQQQAQQHPEEHVMEPQLLSRNPKRVKISTDVRGNLGPPQVMIQNPPGKDWIHDRWQAASNMHGKAIPGQHWVMLEFDEPVVVSKIVLDWEAAYSDTYVIKGSLEEISKENLTGGQVYTLFDSRVSTEGRQVEEHGQSPGVKKKTPLHVVHTINEMNHNWPIKYLRIGILNSAMGWGVSLWQVDVYGLFESQVNQR